MDIPEGNTLPDPYSDNAATTGQGTYSWRGRITCSPAAGYAGTVDRAAAAGAQVSAFMGNALISNFAVSGEVVAWTGDTDWGYRRMSEANEAYDLEILNGPAMVRTISSLTSPGFTYTTAMQTADFGGPIISLSVRLYQIDALGRGVPATQTLTFKESAP